VWEKKGKVMPPRIVFEDDTLLILDKPSGWIVTEARTTKNQPVVQTWLKDNFKPACRRGRFPVLNDKLLRNGIVHRLDKETSGLLVVAKTKKAFDKLQAQFKAREVEKKYTALVHGRIELKQGEIEVPVGRLPWNRERFGVLPGGKKAATRYKVIKHYPDYTLLILTPKTGRTHQIRIHLKYLGHPIVSDLFYAGRKTARCDRTWCPRLFLHASEISFKHPETGKTVSFKSDLPSELKTCLKKLTSLN
jgi:23S rRNA pseudouridine1911/1915/1917 synthase